MKKKRGRLEVIFDILKIIQNNRNSIRPTPLLRFSNLSTKSFNDYYSDLIKKGFIKEIFCKKGNKYISLSDKGFKYLEKYKTITRFIDGFDL